MKNSPAAISFVSSHSYPRRFVGVRSDAMPRFDQAFGARAQVRNDRSLLCSVLIRGMCSVTRHCKLLLALFVVISVFSARANVCSAWQGKAAEIYDTQAVTIPMMDPAEVISKAQLPPGFSLVCSAHEPDVQQPIGMSWDDRGRLWIAENYTYSESAKKFDMELSDRIVIFEDTNKDGVFDKRKIFPREFKKLTSIEHSTQGLWVMAPPYLYFVPDENHDDVPDSKPIIVLSGFDEGMRHNVANGLRFGPDGWLYGRHGILGVSNITLENSPFAQKEVQFPLGATGLSQAAPSKPTKLHCGIWRYHPKLHKFEVVCQGTTNPWGMDWDAYGNLFFINTVIGHLWHAIPNAHLQRMYGEDLDPLVYELLPQIADHVHWDEKGEDWKATRKGSLSSGTDAAGGGHAHSGMMIYQGNRWPAAYRNQLFTLNFHGQRINQDSLVREGAGFVGKHNPDFAFWKDPWFRGIELSTGPDGHVYILDWSDIGECHDDDGIHRHSGRIYRLAYEADKSVTTGFETIEELVRDKGFHTLSAEQLVKLLQHPNAWYSTWALKALQDNYVQRLTEFISSLEKIALGDWKSPHEVDSPQFVDPVVMQLRALNTLSNCQVIRRELVLLLIRSKQPEQVKAWLVKYLSERFGNKPIEDDIHGSELREEFMEMLDVDGIDAVPGLVRLYTAALLPKLTYRYNSKLLSMLMMSEDLANDRDFPLVLWYGMKTIVDENPEKIAKLLPNCKIPKVTGFVVRRLAELQDTAPEGLNWIIGEAASSKKSDFQELVVNGLWHAFQGRHNAKTPNQWERLAKALEKHPNPVVREHVTLLSSIFGNGISPEKLIELAMDGKAEAASRKSAIESLGSIPGAAARETLWNLIGDQFLGGVAAASIGRAASIEDANRLASSYAGLWPPGKLGVISALSSKPELMMVLVESIENGKIPVEAIDASTWRQFRLAGGWEVLERARKLNPKMLNLDANKKEQIDSLEAKLSDEALASANASNGRAVWNKVCSNCHKLFGEGGQIGPELTGGQRSNKRYLLENIVAPSAQVAVNFHITMFRLDDGTIVTGVPLSENANTITVQTEKEKVILEVGSVQERKKSEQSLMPDGLLDTLSEQDRRDLFKYLMSPGQVPAN